MLDARYAPSCRRRRRRSPPLPEPPISPVSTSCRPPPSQANDHASSLVTGLVHRAIELYNRLLRLVFPCLFCPTRECSPHAGRPVTMAETWTDESCQWRHRDATEDSGSATAESSGGSSETECISDDHAAVRTQAARLLRVASSCPDETLLSLDHYLCKCGKCGQYEAITRDVARVVTWREPHELASVARLLQAFSTYNEAIGYHAEMIVTADECLQTWGGDPDQAFTSFVVLQDVVPFLCANTV